MFPNNFELLHAQYRTDRYERILATLATIFLLLFLSLFSYPSIEKTGTTGTSGTYPLFPGTFFVPVTVFDRYSRRYIFSISSKRYRR
jgi:hypothetical protein